MCSCKVLISKTANQLHVSHKGLLKKPEFQIGEHGIKQRTTNKMEANLSKS